MFPLRALAKFATPGVCRKMGRDRAGGPVPEWEARPARDGGFQSGANAAAKP